MVTPIFKTATLLQFFYKPILLPPTSAIDSPDASIISADGHIVDLQGNVFLLPVTELAE